MLGVVAPARSPTTPNTPFYSEVTLLSSADLLAAISAWLETNELRLLSIEADTADLAAESSQRINELSEAVLQTLGIIDTLATTEQLDALTARVAALETPVEPAPEPTLFGAAVWYPGWPGGRYVDMFAHHVSNVGTPSIVRTYSTENSMVWDWATMGGGASGTNSPTTAGWEDRASWHSMKSDMAAIANGSRFEAIKASVETIPVTGHKRMLTLWHEPENDTQFTGETFLRATMEFGHAVHAAEHPDVLCGPIFMSAWYITGVPVTNDRNITGWVQQAESLGILEDLRAAVDFVGFDPYHEGSKSGNVTGQWADPGFYWDLPRLWVAEWFPAAKFAIGEWGFMPQHDSDARAVFIAAVEAYCDEHNLLACCYWDSALTLKWYIWRDINGDIDTASCNAWGSLYQPSSIINPGG